jgi:hypothetical protein
VPVEVPLLRVLPQWRTEVPLPRGEGLRVGLCWKGNSTHSDDAHRSSNIDAFRALDGLPGVHFVNLQREATHEELARFGSIETYEDRVRDVAARAALMNQCHLVITVDTSVAHVAGALGVPCWTLLAKACDWRWGNDATSTLWYPGMRLFRQDTHGDWRGLLARVRAQLEASLPQRLARA